MSTNLQIDLTARSVVEQKMNDSSVACLPIPIRELCIAVGAQIGDGTIFTLSYSTGDNELKITSHTHDHEVTIQTKGQLLFTHPSYTGPIIAIESATEMAECATTIQSEPLAKLKITIPIHPNNIEHKENNSLVCGSLSPGYMGETRQVYGIDDNRVEITSLKSDEMPHLHIGSSYNDAKFELVYSTKDNMKVSGNIKGEEFTIDFILPTE